MKEILVFVVCLSLSVPLCFSQPERLVSLQTTKGIIQLKENMERYLHDASEGLLQFGPQRRDEIQQVLNHLVIIIGELDSLLSLLGQSKLYNIEGQPENLSPQEVSKFINYVAERVGIIEADLNKRSQSINQALMFRHIYRIKDFVRQTKWILAQIQNELEPS